MQNKVKSQRRMRGAGRSRLLALMAVAATVVLALSSALAAAPAQAGAGTGPEAGSEAQRQAAGAQREAAEARRQAADARLQEAQARLEQAAREIAELSAGMVSELDIPGLVRLQEDNRRGRTMLGVNIAPVGGPGAREDGVLVQGVTPGSPAAEAGIRSGDVLLSLDGLQLDWSGDSSPAAKLVERLRSIEPGTTAELSYRRDGQLATASVEARPWSWPAAIHLDLERLREILPPNVLPAEGVPRVQLLRRFGLEAWGDMEMVALTPGLGEYFQAEEGVLVVRAPTDPLLGLEDGDVIVDIAGRQPADPAHVVRILRSYAPGERLVMTVLRKGERKKLAADIPG